MAARAGRRRHAARADRPHGRRRAAQPRADPAARRPRRRAASSPAVVAGRGASTFVVWALVGPEPRLGARAGQRRRRARSSPARARSASPRRCRSWSARAAARSAGVLIKNAEALERLDAVDTLVVDKTGTLTEGKPRWSTAVARDGITEDELLRARGGDRGAASIRWPRRSSPTPRRAGSRARRGRRTSTSPTGKGVSGTRRRPRASRSAIARSCGELGVDPATLDAAADAHRARGRRRSILVAVDGKLRRACSRSPIRSRPTHREARRRAAARRACASSCSPATTATTAEAVAPQARHRRGRRRGRCPTDKAAVVERLQARGPRRRDGRRRHQRRARARRRRRRHRDGHRHRRRDRERRHHAGQAAISRASSRARALSRATMRNIRQNLFFAFVYNGSACRSRRACSTRCSASCCRR